MNVKRYAVGDVLLHDRYALAWPDVRDLNTGTSSTYVTTRRAAARAGSAGLPSILIKSQRHDGLGKLAARDIGDRHELEDRP